MKILAIYSVLEDADMELIQSMLVEEERFAWEAYLDGWLREHYESDMPSPAVSVIEAESLEVAKAKLDDLPLLAAGLISVSLFPLRPFRNWEVLFRDEEKRS